MFEQDNLHAQNYSFRFVFVSKRTGCGRFGHAAIAVTGSIEALPRGARRCVAHRYKHWLIIAYIPEVITKKVS